MSDNEYKQTIQMSSETLHRFVSRMITRGYYFSCVRNHSDGGWNITFSSAINLDDKKLFASIQFKLPKAEEPAT